MSGSNMAWLQQLSPGGVLRELALLPQALRCLKAIRENSNPPIEWSDALKALISAADSGNKPDGVDSKDWPALLEEWGDLKSKIKIALPDALRPLTFQLSDLLGKTIGAAAEPGLLNYPLSAGTTASGTSTVGGLAFSTSAKLGATAEVGFQVYDAAPDWATALGYVKPDAECLVRLGVHGQLTASAGASAAPVWGSVAVSTSAGGDGSLDYYFNFPASRYVAQVLIDTIPEMVSPADLSGVLNACRPGSDFAMVVTELNGQLALSGQVGVGYSWGIASVGVGTSGGQTIDFGANVSLTAGVDLSVDDYYRCVVESVGSSALLRIERDLKKSTTTSIGLSATVDVNGLQAALTPIVDKALPSSAALTSKLDELLDIQGIALKAISKQLGITGDGKWDDIATLVLKENLAPAGGRVAATTALSSALADRFDALAKAYLSNATGLIDSVSGQINAAVANALGSQVLTDAAKKIVARAVSALQKAVDDAYKKFATAASGVSDDIAKALELPSTVVVGDELKKARADATALTAPLVEWLKTYERLRSKIAAAITKVEQQKLAIAWAHSYNKKTDRSTIVEVKFSAATDSSKALFSEMRAGRLSQYTSLLDSCVKEGSAAQTQWLMTDVLQRTSTDSLTFNFFGLLNTSATRTSMDGISVSSDSDGRVTAASDSVTLSSVLKSNGRLAQASIDLNLQMLAKGAPPPLSSTISASGDSFTPKNEDDFFGLLTLAGAVGPDVGSTVRRLLWTGAATSTATLTNAELSVFFSPDMAGWNRLLATSPADMLLAVRARCLRLLALALKRGDLSGVPDGSPASWIASWRSDTQLSEDDFWAIAGRSTWKSAFDDFVSHGLDGIVSGSLLANDRVKQGVQKLWQIQRISLGVRDAWTNLVQVNDLLAKVGAGAVPGQEANVRRQLDALSDGIRSNLADVFTGVYIDSGKPTKVSWQFLALIMTLSDIANAGAPADLLTSAKATIGGAEVAYLVA